MKRWRVQTIRASPASYWTNCSATCTLPTWCWPWLCALLLTDAFPVTLASELLDRLHRYLATSARALLHHPSCCIAVQLRYCLVTQHSASKLAYVGHGACADGAGTGAQVYDCPTDATLMRLLGDEGFALNYSKLASDWEVRSNWPACSELCRQSVLMLRPASVQVCCVKQA